MIMPAAEGLPAPRQPREKLTGRSEITVYPVAC